jgi:hypothetical protein
VQVVAPTSGTPHQQTIDERKKELGVDKLRYTAAFMMQFSEVRRSAARSHQATEQASGARQNNCVVLEQ